MEIIRVENLGKTYKIQKNNQGFIKSFTSLIKKEWEQKVALDNINFTINKGDIVGYIGPNGAGKSTTIKILAGILHPSVGQVLVNGIVPYKERIKNARRIALVTGQRTNLFWDLPIIDTFNLMKRVYKIPQDKFKKNLDMLTDIIGVGEFINTPARQLSLGQRMRADI
ncbi:ATP-binding cassette domain-containing protein, partial [Ruminiclostridium cellobioparum]